MTTTLLTGATVWRGRECQAIPGWLLVDGEHIAATGVAGDPAPEAENTLRLTGSHILPGFVDSHAHTTLAAWQPRGGDGAGWPNLPTALDAIRDAAAREPSAAWLVFWNARPSAWPQRRLPTAAELDAAAPGRRILVNPVELHHGSLSSPALARLAFDRYHRSDHPDDVLRDRRGRLTGEVWEAAYGQALATALDDTEEYRGSRDAEELIRGELDRCLTHGITRVHEAFVRPRHHERMQRLAAHAAPRLSWAMGAEPGMYVKPRNPDSLPDGRYGDSGRELKIFLDGGEHCALCMPASALATLTAKAVRQCVAARDLGPLREAIARRTRIHGRELHLEYLRYSDRELATLLQRYLNADIRVRMHALGNLAARQAATVLRQLKAPPGSNIVDHLLLLDAATADLVAGSAGFVACQPGFLQSFGPAITAIGADRALDLLASRRLLGAGARLVLSSDYPAGPLDPLANLRLAVRRTLPDGTVLRPDQALIPAEAVRAYTTTAAASLGLPDRGISAGEPADLAICDGDPFAEETRVTQTWIGGQRRA